MPAPPGSIGGNPVPASRNLRLSLFRFMARRSLLELRAAQPRVARSSSDLEPDTCRSSHHVWAGAAARRCSDREFATQAT
jgi:hypothetical protein